MRVQPMNMPILWGDGYRVLLAVALFAAVLTLAPKVSAEAGAKIARPMVVYKSPTCGCCGAWVEHMEQAGFATKIKHSNNLDTIKDQLGISPVYQACHTATLQGYVFEGHVPAEVVQQFLADKPSDAIGLAVPGMPLGSPGMEAGGRYRPYQVLQLNKDGSSMPYARVTPDAISYSEKK